MMLRSSALIATLGGLAAGSLALGSGVAVASAPAKATPAPPRMYTFIFDVKHGSYASEQTLEGYTQNETDNFGGQSFVGKVHIPATGAFTILRPATRFSMWPDSKGVPEWRTYDNAGLNCHAHMTNNDPDIPPPILKGSAVKGSDSLNFKLQLGASVIITGATGHTGQVAQCSDLFPDDSKAFFPAEKRYMPEMVTVHLKVSLKKIRDLKAVSEIVIDVTAHDDALKLPPGNCSHDGLACTQSISWSGTVTIRRIS
jgi:hypothetical protein